MYSFKMSFCSVPDRHAALAYFAFGERMVGVVAHQRGQVKGGGETRLALRQQIAEALIGIFCSTKAGKLPHRPQTTAMHGGVDAPRVRRLARIAKVTFRIPAG